MPKHKDFIKHFSQSIPQFLQQHSKNISQEIAENIIHEIQKGIAGNGVEIRGNFSITKKQMEKRKSIVFRNLNQKFTNTKQ